MDKIRLEETGAEEKDDQSEEESAIEERGCVLGGGCVLVDAGDGAVLEGLRWEQLQDRRRKGNKGEERPESRGEGKGVQKKGLEGG